jgi:hypothetical protein
MEVLLVLVRRPSMRVKHRNVRSNLRVNFDVIFLRTWELESGII